jgi:hypothetical protein
MEESTYSKLKGKIMETTFENARAGDAVWSLEFGWGEIAAIVKGSGYPVCVRFDDDDRLEKYLFDGKIYRHRNQTLFWDEIPIIAPPRPKRLVTKTVEGWGNVYPGGRVEAIYISHKQALDFASHEAVAKGVKLTGSYEVEE